MSPLDYLSAAVFERVRSDQVAVVVGIGHHGRRRPPPQSLLLLEDLSQLASEHVFNLGKTFQPFKYHFV